MAVPSAYQPSNVTRPPKSVLSKPLTILFLLLFAVLGSYFLLSSHAAPTASPAALVGDLNSDGQVNLADLSIFLTHWQQTGIGLAEDFDNNGVINLFDLSTLLGNWGKTSGSGGTGQLLMAYDLAWTDASLANVTNQPAGINQDNLFSVTPCDNSGSADCPTVSTIEPIAMNAIPGWSTQNCTA